MQNGINRSMKSFVQRMIINSIATTAIIVVAMTSIRIIAILRMIILIIIIIRRRNIYEKFIRKTQLFIEVNVQKVSRSDRSILIACIMLLMIG